MQPLLYAALVFAAGIGAASELAGPAHAAVAWVLAAAFGAVALLVAVRVRHLRRGMVLAALLGLLGCGLAGYARGEQARAEAAKPAPLDALLARLQPGLRDRVTLNGYLRDAPAVEPDAVRLDLEIVSVSGGWPGAVPWPASGGARIHGYAPGRDPANSEGAAESTRADWLTGLAALQAGQGIAVRVHLRPITSFHDPGVPDRRAALAEAGVQYEATLPAGGWQRQDMVAGPAALAWRARLWGWTSGRIDKMSPPATAANALLRGMLLGDISRLDDATRGALQADGVYHLVVVAGLHLAILAGLLLGGLRRLRIPRGAAWAFTLALLAAYAWVIAGRLPTVRALTMLSVYGLARLWYRERQALNAVGVAALGLLAVRPLDLFTPGWQMSLSAALLLAGVAQPLLARGLGPRRRACRGLDDVRRDEAFPPHVAQFRLILRMVSERLGAVWAPLGALAPAVTAAVLGLAELAVVAFVLQVGFAGFMAVYFHRAGLWSITANTVLVPLAGLLLPLAWIGLVAPWIGFAVRGVAAAALHLALAMAAWPGAGRRVPTPPDWMLVALCAATALWIVAARQRRRLALAATLVAAIGAGMVAWAPFPPRLPPGLSATVLDVGQGDAILVTFPDGRTLLVDGGPRSAHWDSGEQIVAPVLWSLGLQRLDAVLLTHAHLDHIGGLGAVLRDVPPNELWVSDSLPATREVAALLAEARAQGIRVRRIAAGRAFQVGATARLDVLLPPPDYRAGELASNDDSVAVRVASGGDALLLPGDTQAAGEAWMLAHGVPLAAQVLKVAHHGSATSSGAEFLDAVRPSVAVISSGQDNMYGFPAPSTLQRLAAARVFRTDRDGAVQCRLNAGRLEVWLWPQR